MLQNGPQAGPDPYQPHPQYLPQPKRTYQHKSISSIGAPAASAHQQHRCNSKIGALAASAHQHHQQQEVLADLKMSERK